MAIQNITYDDKSYINQNADIPNVNKVSDSDMNEIKSVVNNNATELSNLLQNGTGYLKFADGTLIVYGSVNIQATDSRSAGGLTYYSGEQSVALTQGFVDTNIYVITTVGLANMNIFCNSYYGITDKDTLRILYTNTVQNETRTVSYIAIGRWK